MSYVEDVISIFSSLLFLWNNKAKVNGEFTTTIGLLALNVINTQVNFTRNQNNLIDFNKFERKASGRNLVYGCLIFLLSIVGFENREKFLLVFWSTIVVVFVTSFLSSGPLDFVLPIISLISFYKLSYEILFISNDLFITLILYISLLCFLFYICFFSSDKSFSYGESILVSQLSTLFLMSPLKTSSIISNYLLFVMLSIAGKTVVIFFFIQKFISNLFFKFLLPLVIVLFLESDKLLETNFAEVPFSIFIFLSNKYPERQFLILLWLVTSILTVIYTLYNNNRHDNSRSITIYRKFYHLVILLVYIPGMLVDLDPLVLASGAVTIVFFSMHNHRSLQYTAFLPSHTQSSGSV